MENLLIQMVVDIKVNGLMMLHKEMVNLLMLMVKLLLVHGNKIN